MTDEKQSTEGRRTYLFAGGGTAGHVYPAIAIASAIRRREPLARFVYIGVRRGAEAEIVPRYPDLFGEGNLRFVTAVGMPDRLLSFGLVRFAFALAVGTVQALGLLRRIRPAGVIGTGGYASAPAVIAARLLGIPVLLNEQNAEPGKVTRLMGRLASTVTLAFEATLPRFPKNGVFVGYPVRDAVREATRLDRKTAHREVLEHLGMETDRALVLVTGGSLGARSINHAMVEIVRTVYADDSLRRRLAVVHGVGRCDTIEYNAWDDTRDRLTNAGVPIDRVTDFYRPVRYLFDIERYYAAADVVVCRGGAGSVAEAAAFGRPTLIVPKSGLPGEHQVRNALALAERGACRVLREVRDDAARTWIVDPDALLREILDLIDLPDDETRRMGDVLSRHDRPDCLQDILKSFYSALDRA